MYFLLVDVGIRQKIISLGSGDVMAGSQCIQAKQYSCFIVFFLMSIQNWWHQHKQRYIVNEQLL